MSDVNVNFGNPTAKFLKYPRRRALLPWWMKFFCWFFMIIGAIAPVALLVGALHITFNLEIFGIKTTNPLSIKGVIDIAIMLFTGVVAFGLWTEKDWAINLAKVNTIINITVCIVVMLYFMLSGNFNIRLELILLFLFIYKLNKIQYDWENFGSLDEGVEYTDPVPLSE